MPLRNPDFARHERDWGIHLMANDYLPDEYKGNFSMAMDAQPALISTASGGIPFWMTNYVDPEVIRVLQAPNAGAEILGERKVGDWTTQTATFVLSENTGQVASYGDTSTNGRSDANVNFPQRQSYLFQTVIEYGDLQVDRAGEARLSWISEVQTSGAMTVEKFRDYTYHFGVTGLQNYGMLNDPALSTALTPATKSAGGTAWIVSGHINATALEVFADIQALYVQLLSQTNGRVQLTDPMTLAVPVASQLALTDTSTYNVNVMDMLAKNFPRLKVKADPRYATAAGNVVQLIADKFDGKDVAFCGFNEKLRDHAPRRRLSSWEQKKTGGTWGAVIRYPAAISQMLGV